MTKALQSLLLEKIYTLPFSGAQKMYDLYCLYYLWFSLGGGKEAYNYEPTGATSHKRAERINRSFEECLLGIAQIMDNGIYRASLEEAENAFDEDLIPSEVLYAWLRENRDSWDFQDFQFGDELPRVDWQQLIELFNAPFWDVHADQYGGKKWADLSIVGRDLGKVIKGGKLKDIMYHVDIIYDLEHNTGRILEKKPLATLRVDQRDLDRRAKFSSAQAYLPFVSKPVADLVRGSLNYLEPADIRQNKQMNAEEIISTAGKVWDTFMNRGVYKFSALVLQWVSELGQQYDVNLIPWASRQRYSNDPKERGRVKSQLVSGAAQEVLRQLGTSHVYH